MKRSLSIQFEGAIITPGTHADAPKFVPGVIHNLYRINHHLGYELFFTVSNENLNVQAAQLLEILEGETIRFNFATGGGSSLENEYNISWEENNFKIDGYNHTVHVETWDEIYSHLRSFVRKTSHSRNTHETKIQIEINPGGSGKYDVSTGLGFFDHMLEQFSKHSNIDLTLRVQGDLHIDEHHTIEDTGIALGEAVLKALGSKKGLERYGFLLPMDDCLAQAAIDFGGRSWLVWDAEFKREYVGDMPTEMVYHFFKSFCDGAKCNLNIKVEGTKEHHKIESIFKAFAKAVKMAVKVDYDNSSLPTTKGIL